MRSRFVNGSYLPQSHRLTHRVVTVGTCCRSLFAAVGACEAFVSGVGRVPCPANISFDATITVVCGACARVWLRGEKCNLPCDIALV